MNKINFENLPSTNTPLSAENLNLLQDNVEDAIDNVSIELDDEVSTSSTNGVENQAITNYVNSLKPIELYYNASGSNDEITLSDSSANYDYIDIFFRQQDSTFSFTRVFSPNGKHVMLMGYHTTNSGNALGISARNVDIINNKITTQATNRYMTSNIVTTSDALSGGAKDNKIYIVKVDGYKLS